MNGDPLIWQLILQAILIALNAVFACAEIAVISFNDIKLSKMAEDGNKRARRLMRLTSSPSRFLATIQVAITLAGFLGSAFAADNFSERIVKALVGAGVQIPAATLNTISVIVITLLLSFFTLVFGELVPKQIAMKDAERVALGLSGLISCIAKVFAPIVWLLTVSTNGILRLCGIDPHAQPEEVTEEEIRMMVDVGTEKGTIEASEKEMIQNVFEFDDVSASDILTHRTQVDILWLDESDAAWEALIHETRHSHYPVCGETADDVRGILDVKDYFRLTDRSRQAVLREAVSPARFVPETVKADALFSDMKRGRSHFAVVLDEYGGMSGIVTMNDLIEQIVGDMGDGEDEDAPLLTRIDETHWRAHGAVPLDALIDAMGLELPNDEFDTLGGLIYSVMSEIPEDGSTFTVSVSGLDVDVRRVYQHRVVEAIVSRAPQKE